MYMYRYLSYPNHLPVLDILLSGFFLGHVLTLRHFLLFFSTNFNQFWHIASMDKGKQKLWILFSCTPGGGTESPKPSKLMLSSNTVFPPEQQEVNQTVDLDIISIEPSTELEALRNGVLVLELYSKNALYLLLRI